MSTNEQIWKKVLDEIELTVSKPNFLTFFKPTTLLTLENNVATIGTPSAMIMNMLQKRFSPLIKDLLNKQTGQNITIIFIPKTPVKEKPLEEQTAPLFSSRETAVQPRPLTRVRPDYTFEALAVSQSNQLAVVSAQNVAQHLGKTYNPLFIYGPVGVGKTHLMQAIANEVYKKDNSLKIIYITSEEFTNEVVEAIRSSDTGRMKKRFRSANLLIIDDVQFIAGKDRVQEELFHTFNILIDNTAQIVLSSDRPPSEIKKLEARLSSRFAGGLTVDVESPDFETRTAIVLKKAERFGFELSIEVAKIIAEKEQDVRSLEGALLRVITEASTKKETITTSFATSALDEGEKEKKSVLHPDDVIKSTCEFYGIKPTQLRSPKRNASLVKARQVTMYLLYKELGITYMEIGNLLGGRDHTTIMHGVDKMVKLAVEDNALQREIMGISKGLRG